MLNLLKKKTIVCPYQWLKLSDIYFKYVCLSVCGISVYFKLILVVEKKYRSSLENDN